MKNEEFLQRLGEVLGKNVGSKLTNELASGIYGTVQQILEKLNPDKQV